MVEPTTTVVSDDGRGGTREVAPTSTATFADPGTFDDSVVPEEDPAASKKEARKDEAVTTSRAFWWPSRKVVIILLLLLFLVVIVVIVISISVRQLNKNGKEDDYYSADESIKIDNKNRDDNDYSNDDDASIVQIDCSSTAQTQNSSRNNNNDDDMENDDANSCFMLLIEEADYDKESRFIFPITVTTGDHVEFGERIMGDVPQRTRKVAAAIDPTSGSMAYAFVVANDDDGGDDDKIFVRFIDGEGQTRAVIEIPSYPHAIHVLEEAVFLGIGPTVGWINFAAAAAAAAAAANNNESITYEQLIQRTESYKAYDLFARRDKDLLIAIDDIMSPFYADSFRLDGPYHTPIHQNDWNLGTDVNFRYMDAAVNDEDLILLGRYHACHGHCWAQQLRRFNMDQLSNNNSTFYEPIILEEGESVDYDSVLDYSTINMDWNGFIINSNSDDEVVIASGDRGIIAVPSKFMPNSLKRVSSLGGGNVRSVNRCGDAIWGLVKFPGDDGEEQRLIKMDKNLCPQAPGISLPISQDVSLV